jgi:hypothetical protein
MTHAIYRVISFKISAPYTLQVEFDDQTMKKMGQETLTLKHNSVISI